MYRSGPFSDLDSLILHTSRHLKVAVVSRCNASSRTVFAGVFKPRSVDSGSGRGDERGGAAGSIEVGVGVEIMMEGYGEPLRLTPTHCQNSK